MRVLPIGPRPPAADRLLIPTDEPRASASGPDPHQVLVVGPEAVIARGVRTHGLALAGQLARRLPPFTGQGADVETVPVRSCGVRAVRRALQSRPVAHLDAVVVVAAPRPLAARRMRRLVAELRRHVPAEVPIAVATLDAVGQGVQGVPLPTLPGEGAVAVPLPAIGSPAACERYATWAGVLARALAPHLAVGARRGSLIDESRRQEAVERLTAVDLDRDEELDRIVAFARAGYGSRSAALSLIDGERTRFAVRHGVEPAEVARDASLCAVALPQRRGLLARDTRRDPRLRSLPAVLDGTAGFYAGHPVDGPDGLPVAVLCVFDPEPRPEGTDDLVLLHDLAVAARRRLFGAVADRG